MPPPKTYKSGIWSQPTTCQVHTGAYVSLLAPGKTYYTACHPRKTTAYILHVVPITTHTHDIRKSTGKKKYRKYNKIKERKEKKASKGKGQKIKESTRKARKVLNDPLALLCFGCQFLSLCHHSAVPSSGQVMNKGTVLAGGMLRRCYDIPPFSLRGLGYLTSFFTITLSYYHTIISSYRIISYHIRSYHIMSYHIVSYHIISYHIMSYYHTIMLSYYHTIILLYHYTSILSYYHTIILSYYRTIMLSCYHAIILSYDHTIILPHYHTIILLI